MAVEEPTLELERELLRSAPLVIGMDEVGRGAIAGPVAVGALALGPAGCAAGFPEGLRDSKRLSERRRTALEPLVQAWAPYAIGFASAAEIDRDRIAACLGAAAKRALASLHEAGVPVAEAVILLDGSHDWLTPRLRHPLRVVVRPRADQDCASVAGAALVAKVERDRRMIACAAQEAYAPYGWMTNKGYGSAAHLAAIDAHGPSDLHRRSWLGGRGES